MNKKKHETKNKKFTEQLCKQCGKVVPILKTKRYCDDCTTKQGQFDTEYIRMLRKQMGLPEVSVNG